MAKPRWWTIRPAQNRKPATYRCPLCGNQLPSLQPHMLITPEGDASRRRHAHSSCVLAARQRGRLPTEAEWRAAERRRNRATPSGGRADASRGPADVPRGLLSRLRGRLTR